MIPPIFRAVVLLICAALGVPSVQAGVALPVGFIATPLGIPFVQPVGLTFSPSGRMFVWEKRGRVWIVENGVKLGTPLIDISEEVGDWRDFGLLGFALDPNYEANGRFYLSYVVDYHHAKFFGTPNYNPSADEYFKDTIARVTRYAAAGPSGFRVRRPCQPDGADRGIADHRHPHPAPVARTRLAGLRE